MGRKPGEKRPPGPDAKVTLTHWAVYLPLRLLTLVGNLSPWPVIQAGGKVIGLLAHMIDKRHRRIMLLNMDRVFGDQKTEQWKRQTVRDCYIHFGRALFETLAIAKITPDNFRDRVELVNVDVFHEALAKGQGAILCTAHYGNWEIMNLCLGYLGIPMSVMARPMDNPLVHRYLESLRARTGNRVIYKHGAVRKLITTLKENRVVGIVNDQNVHDRNRLLVDFFGHPAATTPTPAALCHRQGTPIITGYATPLGGGRYQLKFGSLITAEPDAAKDEETLRITQLLNQRLEQQITDHPIPWFWFHKRYKTGKDGLTDYYSRPRSI